MLMIQPAPGRRQGDIACSRAAGGGTERGGHVAPAGVLAAGGGHYSSAREGEGVIGSW